MIDFSLPHVGRRKFGRPEQDVVLESLFPMLPEAFLLGCNTVY
jgi:hypothetical protein